MDMNSRRPVLGDFNDLYSTTCSRTVPGGTCNRPGGWHIIWFRDKGIASIACYACIGYLKENLEFFQAHRLVPDCTSIYGYWFPDEETCRVPTGCGDGMVGVRLTDR